MGDFFNFSSSLDSDSTSDDDDDSGPPFDPSVPAAPRTLTSSSRFESF